MPMACAVSTESADQEPKLIVQEVNVDGIATPLQALIDTGASNNFVRTEMITRYGLPVSEGKMMIVRLANGSCVKMPRKITRLKMKFEDFRGEADFILLDLDEKFDMILGMPWLRQYQPSIDWKSMPVSVDKLLKSDLDSQTKDVKTVIWAHTSVEVIPDGPEDYSVCDGPQHSEGFAQGNI